MGLVRRWEANWGVQASNGSATGKKFYFDQRSWEELPGLGKGFAHGMIYLFTYTLIRFLSIYRDGDDGIYHHK